MQVELHVPNADHKLLPGMYAQVHFRAPSAGRLAIIPGSAVKTLGNGAWVYTIDGGNRVHAHKVEIGTDLGGQVEIASGIAAEKKRPQPIDSSRSIA